MTFQKKWVAALSIAFCVAVISSPALAWDATGHIIIAQIAYDNLTPMAKQDVNTLIQQTNFATSFPQFTPFIYSAPWPDYFIFEVKPPTGKTQTIYSFVQGQTKTWHYTDDPIVVGNYHPKPLSDNNSIWAMNYLIPNLSELIQEKKYDLAAIDLVFITHIVGDMHQPLHNANLYDSDFPHGDRGGNSYKIKSTFGATELHAAWDEALGQFTNWPNFSPYPGYHPPLSLVKTTATQFESLCGGKKAADIKPADWEKESHAIAANFVYPMKNPNAPQLNGALSSQYISSGQQVSDVQMCLAGKRLAAVLNKIFTAPISTNQS